MNRSVHFSDLDQEIRPHFFRMLNPPVCGHICVDLNEDDSEFYVKPLCRFILFGFKHLALVKPVPAAAHFENSDKIHVEEIHTKKEDLVVPVDINLEQGPVASEPQVVKLENLEPKLEPTAAPVPLPKVVENGKTLIIEILQVS